MTKITNISIFAIFLLGLFFLYLIVNYLTQSFVIETMTTPLSMGKVTIATNNK